MLYFSNNHNTVPHVTLLGDVKVPSPTNHFRRKPIEYILYVVTDGEMLLVEDDTLYELKQGDYILLSADRTHHGLPLDSSVSYFFIHFLWEGLGEVSLDQTAYQNELIRSKIDEKNGTFLLPKSGHIPQGLSLVLTIYKEMCNEQKNKDQYYCYNLSCFLIRMLVTLSRYNSINPLLGNLGIDIIDYLQSNSCNNITSSDIEAYFHLNFDYLNRKFKHQTGETIMHYHNECRINEAKKLLNSGMYSVAEIADKLHYCNEFYFSRAFKKQTGIAPSRFRQTIY